MKRPKDILSVRKYCQLFTHKTNTFLLNNAPFKQMGRTPKTPFPLQHVNPHLKHQCLDRQRSQPQMIGSHTSAQLCNRVPIGYNRIPQIHPQNCPFPSTITTPSNTPILRPTPLTIPNGIRIQSAVLPQYPFRTHRQTNRWDRQQVYAICAYNARQSQTRLVRSVLLALRGE